MTIAVIRWSLLLHWITEEYQSVYQYTTVTNESYMDLFYLPVLVCTMSVNTCISCPDIQIHMETPVPDFVQHRGSDSERSAPPAAFHVRPLWAAEESRLLFPPQWYSTCSLACSHPCCLPPVQCDNTHSPAHKSRQTRPYHSSYLAEDRQRKHIHLLLVSSRGIRACQGR